MITLGIDIGSTTSKCVILRDREEIVAKSLVTGGMGTDAPETSISEVFSSAGLSHADVDYAVVTGYGRMNFSKADAEMSELTCHAAGGAFIFDGLRTIIDIGGQDAKVICLSDNGRMSNFLMNDKCAAGTGRFLEVMANILKMDVAELGACAASSSSPASISSTCTVFAESEVISQLALGTDRNDIVAGICESVATRVGALARRAEIRERICMSGGVAANEAIRRSLSQKLSVNIEYDPLAQYFGAIGAAVCAHDKAAKALKLNAAL